MTRDELDGLADRLFAALTAYDLDTVRAMCAPDATITRNGRTRPLDEALDAIAALRGVVGEHRYTDVRRVVGDDAVVEEHRAVSTTPSGAAVDLAACVVIRVDPGGRITSLDEYVDVSGFPAG